MTLTATTATKQPLPTRERSLDNPTLWNQHFTFTAYIQALRVQVQLSYGNHLCCWLSYQDAALLDLPPCCTLAVTPAACLAWVRRYVPQGWERDWLEQYFIKLDPDLHWTEVRRLGQAAAERVEAQRIADAEWRSSAKFKRQQWQALLLDSMKSA